MGAVEPAADADDDLRLPRVGRDRPQPLLEPGDLLVKIDPAPYEAAVAQAEAAPAVGTPAGAVLTTVADASTADGATALDEAVAAQPSWAATAPREFFFF